jgi:hypothetical protein
MAKSGSNLLFWLFIVLGTAAIAWMFRDLWMPQPDVAEPPALSEPSEVAEPVRDGPPRHPIEPPSIKSGEPRDTRPLPDLDDSDAYFLLETGLIFGVPFESLLLRDGIIDRFVATVDNLPRAHVSLKIRPAKSLSTPFTVEEDFGNGQLFFLGEENFSRYDSLVDQITNANINDVVDMYRRYYPLFQQSYERLGYPNAYFNDRLIEVIDLLLSTPVAEEPIALMRPNVLYEFALPELEELSSGQKLLLRMGNKHAAAIKEVLRELRSHLANEE